VRAAEQFRVIRTKISQHPKRPHSIAISSGNPGDGKTFNAINLAATIALRDDARVVLVDGDLRRSAIARNLGIPETPGITEVLTGKTKLRSALVQIEEIERLYVLPAGEHVSKPAELLDSPGWRKLIKALESHFQYIIIDAPPVAAVTDYEVIQDTCDGVIIVVRQDHSNRSAFMKAVSAVGAEKRLGIILNSATDDWILRHSVGYYYGNYDAYYQGKK
jgi:capsular exopolysaccharide synthesis family protein